MEEAVAADGARRGKGRPKIDDREQVLGFMTTRIAQGLNVSEAARPGLTIRGYQPGLGGKMVLADLRRMSAATLERRYRELAGPEKAEFLRMTEAFRVEGAGAIGISIPKRPESFISDKPLSRGRPRKNSRA